MNLITPYNKQGQPHGYWESYYYNGQLEYKGNYDNGKLHGYWEWYYHNGNYLIVLIIIGVRGLPLLG
jgi:antitoxin component YwqK of YwqJK toxin-antitoxin module